MVGAALPGMAPVANALHDDFYERNKDIPIEGFANGGLVGTPPTAYDPMKVADIVASIDAPHNY